jgi:hypothetical protein
VKDIVEKVDRLRTVVAQAATIGPDNPNANALISEAGSIAIDLVGEMVVNSRRIAVALESLVRPVITIEPAELVQGISGYGGLAPDDIEKLAAALAKLNANA